MENSLAWPPEKDTLKDPVRREQKLMDSLGSQAAGVKHPQPLCASFPSSDHSVGSQKRSLFSEEHVGAAGAAGPPEEPRVPRESRQPHTCAGGQALGAAFVLMVSSLLSSGAPVCVHPLENRPPWSLGHP